MWGKKSKKSSLIPNLFYSLTKKVISINYLLTDADTYFGTTSDFGSNVLVSAILQLEGTHHGVMAHDSCTFNNNEALIVTHSFPSKWESSRCRGGTGKGKIAIKHADLYTTKKKWKRNGTMMLNIFTSCSSVCCSTASPNLLEVLQLVTPQLFLTSWKCYSWLPPNFQPDESATVGYSTVSPNQV